MPGEKDASIYHASVSIHLRKKIYNFKLFLSEWTSDRRCCRDKNLNIMLYCLFINEIDYFLCAILLEKKTCILLHNKLPYLLVWFTALYSFSKKRRRKIFFSLKYFCTTWIHMIYILYLHIYKIQNDSKNYFGLQLLSLYSNVLTLILSFLKQRDFSIYYCTAKWVLVKWVSITYLGFKITDW